MAKLSSINKNNKRIKLSNKFFKKRQALKKIIMNKKLHELNRNEIKQHIFNLQLEVQEQVSIHNNVDDFLDNTDIFDEFEEILADQEFGIFILTVLNNLLLSEIPWLFCILIGIYGLTKHKVDNSILWLNVGIAFIIISIEFRPISKFIIFLLDSFSDPIEFPAILHPFGPCGPKQTGNRTGGLRTLYEDLNLLPIQPKRQDLFLYCGTQSLQYGFEQKVPFLPAK